jgi:hypothetical protein
MKVYFEVGKTTCAIKKGKFCRFFGSKHFGSIPWCCLFNVELFQEKGWSKRCYDCLNEFPGGKNE